MCDQNKSEKDIDTYWPSQRDIDMGDTCLKNGSFSGTIRKSVNEQLKSVEHNNYNAEANEQDNGNSLSDIDNLLSELSSKYCLKETPFSQTSKYNLNLKGTSKIPIDYSSNSGRIEKLINIVNVSDSEESDNENVSNKESLCNVPSSKFSNFVSLSESETNVPNIDKPKKPTTKSTVQKMTKDEKAAAKKTLQEEKRMQKEFKKAEDLKAKQMKKMTNQTSKNLKPEEYLKQIEVIIDDGLSEKPLAKDMFKLFEENDIKYLKKSQIYSNIITWQRTSQSHVIYGDQLISKFNTEDCDVVLFILECEDLVAMIEKEELIAHFKSIQEIIPGKMITAGLYGLNDYLRIAKNRKKRCNKNNVSETETKKNDFTMFDKHIIEANLTKVQVLLGICYRYLDTSQDIAALVNHMTKAVAQIPYKMKKREKIEQTENYMVGDNKDCVLVDKNGNGLSRLWQQNITSFPLARLDLAESIIASYPTYNSLMQAYERCAGDTAGEKMLENLEIRRAAGPLTNFRKVGPEFSKKMFKYYNSRDPDMLL